MTHCRVCEATTTAFLCKPCGAEIRRVLEGVPGSLPSMQSLLHEVSNLATKQVYIYRANGTSHTSNETTDAEYDEAELWEWLALPAQLRSRAAKSSLPATPTMVNLGARDLFDETVNLLSTIARDLNESTSAEWSRRVEGPRYEGGGFVVRLRGEAPDTIAALLGWLLHNIDAIRWHDGAADMHRDLTRQHSRMRRAVDRIPSRVFAGPCEEEFPDHADVCRRPLYATPQPHFDTDEERERWETGNPIVCDGYRPPFDRSDGYDPNDEGCGTEHSREARRVWQLDDIEDRLLPWSLWEELLPDIARHLTWPHRTTWTRWRKYVAIKTVIDGTEFYRGGDVIDLCYREQGRIKGNTDRAKRNRLSV